MSPGACRSKVQEETISEKNRPKALDLIINCSSGVSFVFLRGGRSPGQTLLPFEAWKVGLFKHELALQASPPPQEMIPGDFTRFSGSRECRRGHLCSCPHHMGVWGAAEPPRLEGVGLHTYTALFSESRGQTR